MFHKLLEDLRLFVSSACTTVLQLDVVIVKVHLLKLKSEGGVKAGDLILSHRH